MKNFLRTLACCLLLSGPFAAKAQVPILNSFPSATATLFIDFDGHTVSGTTWNVSGPIYCGASGLNSTQITEAFNRVAEDFRPFNLNVTTDSTKFLSAPINRRMRIIVTTSNAWYGNAGGVAFVNTFTAGDNTPAFVFSAVLAYSAKYVGEAISHEAGHTLGLYHQSRYDATCVKVSDYHSGQGSGEIGWAPIMGVGYYQNFTLWNNGPNTYGCTNNINELSVITGSNGFSYRTDDYNNLFDASTYQAVFSSNIFNISGVIAQNTDQDNFRFIQPANGRFVLNAIPYNVGTGNTGSNLDMQITLYNSSQTVLNVFNPGNLLSSIIDTTLNAGTYYLRVEGRGNQFAPNYASLGSYSLQGRALGGGALPLRRLELTGELLGDRHKLNWLIDADEQVVKQVLEISTDGRSFSPVVEPGTASRAFAYKPYVSAAAQYRVYVLFDNGKSYYSNVVTLRATADVPRPRLVSNFIQSGPIQVTSPGQYEYALYDFQGRQLGKGPITQGLNLIGASGLTNGMYILRLSDGVQQWTEKLVRQ